MRKFLALLLLAAMLIGIVPTTAQAAGDADPMDEVKELLNSVELHPQRTGYAELDRELAAVLMPYSTKDTFTKVKAAYDWTVLNISFSWAPYSQNWAPAYDCFNVKHELTFEKGREHVVPFEVANRAYHALTKHEGVCYDYAATFALLARFIGIDSYVHTGVFEFEPAYGNIFGHHGWVELDLNGETYIFDSQRDYRLSNNGLSTIPYEYFGIPIDKSWRYTQEKEINAKRDKQFVSVTDVANVTVVCSKSCEVLGDGKYPLGSEVILTAECKKPFLGWFDENGKLLCADKTYTFTPEEPVCVHAVCSGEYFTDVKRSHWYCDYAEAALVQGITGGVGAYEFAPNERLTRAMAITLLARYAAADDSAENAGFSDVKGKTWYKTSVNWGVANGVCRGYPDNTFRPMAHISREDFITMLVRFAADDVEGKKLDFVDKNTISEYAKKPMQKAYAIGLIEGYEDDTIRPKAELTRAEGVTILMRLIEWIKANAPEEPEEPTEPTEPSVEPTEPSVEPTEPSVEPTEPSEELTEPSEEPTEPSEEPTEPSEEPTEPSEEPTEPSEEPTEPSEEPTEPSEESTEPSEEPTEPSEESTEPAEEPNEP